jgi:hypothetical protein
MSKNGEKYSGKGSQYHQRGDNGCCSTQVNSGKWRDDQDRCGKEVNEEGLRSMNVIRYHYYAEYGKGSFKH